MIVAFEGMDASGKATQSERLVKALRNRGLDSRRFDFPHYGSYSGHPILTLLQRQWECARREGGKLVPDEAMTALTVQVLQTINRYEHFDFLREWKDYAAHKAPKFQRGADPANERCLFCDKHISRHYGLAENRCYPREDRTSDGVLVLDRYFVSGLAYGGADGLDMEFLLGIHKALPMPDLWLLIDIPADESVKRRPERRDEYEKRQGFMAKVRAQYLSLFRHPVKGFGGAWVIIDGMGSEDDVHAQIISAVESHVLTRHG